MNISERLEKETWDYHLREVRQEIELEDILWREHLREVEEEAKLQFNFKNKEKII